MRPLLSTLFLFLWMVAMLRPIAPLIEYAANRGYFAEVLCINKDKPELGCNGKCVLMQRIKKALGEPVEPTPVKPIQNVSLKDYPIGLLASLTLPEVSYKCVPTNSDGRPIQLPIPPVLEFIHPPS